MAALDARALERKLARNGRLTEEEANALFELLQVVRTSEEAGFDDPVDSFDRVDAWRVTSRSYRSRFTKPPA